MKKLIIANWKMNPKTSQEALSLAVAISKGANTVSRTVSVVIAPPFPFIQLLRKNIACSLGAQDVFWADHGAYTGEVSASQLKSAGVSHVIVGHSERRALGETNETVQKKLLAVLKNGMNPVFCVGEHERKRETAFPPLVRQELHEGLRGIPKNLLKNVVLAYEPIWAIGTGRPATPHDIFEMTILMRKELFRMMGKKRAMNIPILYGGSVDHARASFFLSEGRVDGLLIGGASLNAKLFVNIITSVAAL